jgi:histidine triad (HIT) family protein
MDCLFCEIVNNKKQALKVWENDNFLAFLDIRPINPGHILLIPKNHFNDVFNIPDPLFGELFQIIKKIIEPLKEATFSTRIGLAIEGFGVSHAHVHLVPVNHGNELNPERAKKVPELELQKIQMILIGSFKNII